MKNNIVERLTKLRAKMQELHIDAYIIPTNDFHGSEYVGDYFKTRSYMTGFTGSAGTCIVTLDEAGLWTDGRYFLQAEAELVGTTINLYRMGEEKVPSIIEFLKNKLVKNSCIGFDGRVVSISFVKMLNHALSSLEVKYNFEIDLVGEIWNNRPELSHKDVFELGLEYAGESRNSKFMRVRTNLEKAGADILVLTSLDDIAWILNLRGADVECNPVFLSYLVISAETSVLYINDTILSDRIISNLKKDAILIKPYNQIYEDLKLIDPAKVLMLDESKVNYRIYGCISNHRLINNVNPTTIFKAIKNETEIKNAYLAHIKDGVALTKFIYYLKHHLNQTNLTEISASEILTKLRSEQENFIGLSFETIAGYKEHGAIIHYAATPATDQALSNKSFLLVDSGGQYLEGTTDVTRTISLGSLSAKEKAYYTLVLKGHLALGNAVFLKGTSGANLDILARGALYQAGLNYNHGTGHGVGSLLNVHEGPQNISSSAMRANYPLEVGMITSNEPGVYIPGEFGVRIENLILCKEHQTTAFGHFLCFDNLTLAPYEIDAIDLNLLTETEKNQIHTYHKRVYDTLSPYLTKEENQWLKQIVEAI